MPAPAASSLVTWKSTPIIRRPRRTSASVDASFDRRLPGTRGSPSAATARGVGPSSVRGRCSCCAVSERATNSSGSVASAARSPHRASSATNSGRRAAPCSRGRLPRPDRRETVPTSPSETPLSHPRVRTVPASSSRIVDALCDHGRGRTTVLASSDQANWRRTTDSQMLRSVMRRISLAGQFLEHSTPF